jgi:hypothetical protein
MHFTTATRSVSGASNQSLPIAACFHSSVPPNMDLCGGGRGRGEPTRWLEIAGRLLAARDLVGFKRLTECAVEADKHLSGADELLSGANFPRAAPIQWRCSSSSPTPTPSAVLRSFTRLSRLLSSPPNPYPAAATALRFVQEAFADLPDRLKNALADPPPASGDASAAVDAFWTACPYCSHVYQYQRALVGRALRCQNAGCRRAFLATEIPTLPPIVSGTDICYCAWGFVPKAADLSTNWKPFCPMYSCNQSSVQPASAGVGNVDVQCVENNGGPIHSSATPASPEPAKKSGVSGSALGRPRGTLKKTTARKKVCAVLKKHAPSGVESGSEP